MPRGKHYPEEMREEARRLRREGWTLGEIAKKLGPPKNTLTLWVRDIALTPEQQQRIKDHEREMLSENQRLGAAYHRAARLKRIAVEQEKAEAFLSTLDNIHRTNHIAAAMLYLGEGAKAEGAFSLGNSNPQVIRYWMYLLRTSFQVDEAKFRLQILSRIDQNDEELERFWMETTGVASIIKGHKDPRTEGKPTRRANYKGVCAVFYYDVSIRRYLDALAHGLMERAVGEG
jgi:hypothetical protein